MVSQSGGSSVATPQQSAYQSIINYTPQSPQQLQQAGYQQIINYNRPSGGGGGGSSSIIPNLSSAPNPTPTPTPVPIQTAIDQSAINQGLISQQALEALYGSRVINAVNDIERTSPNQTVANFRARQLGYGSLEEAQQAKTAIEVAKVMPKTPFANPNTLQTSPNKITFQGLPESITPTYIKLYTNPETGEPIQNIRDYLTANKIPFTESNPTPITNLKDFLKSLTDVKTYDVLSVPSNVKIASTYNPQILGRTVPIEVQTGLPKGVIPSPSIIAGTVSPVTTGDILQAVLGLRGLAIAETLGAGVATAIGYSPVGQAGIALGFGALQTLLPPADSGVGNIDRQLERAGILALSFKIPAVKPAVEASLASSFGNEPVATTVALGTYALKNPIEIGVLTASGAVEERLKPEYVRERLYEVNLKEASVRPEGFNVALPEQRTVLTTDIGEVSRLSNMYADVTVSQKGFVTVVDRPIFQTLRQLGIDVKPTYGGISTGQTLQFNRALSVLPFDLSEEALRSLDLVREKTITYAEAQKNYQSALTRLQKSGELERVGFKEDLDALKQKGNTDAEARLKIAKDLLRYRQPKFTTTLTVGKAKVSQVSGVVEREGYDIAGTRYTVPTVQEQQQFFNDLAFGTNVKTRGGETETTYLKESGVKVKTLKQNIGKEAGDIGNIDIFVAKGQETTLGGRLKEFDRIVGVQKTGEISQGENRVEKYSQVDVSKQTSPSGKQTPRLQSDVLVKSEPAQRSITFDLTKGEVTTEEKAIAGTVVTTRPITLEEVNKFFTLKGQPEKIIPEERDINSPEYRKELHDTLKRIYGNKPETSEQTLIQEPKSLTSVEAQVQSSFKEFATPVRLENLPKYVGGTGGVGSESAFYGVGTYAEPSQGVFTRSLPASTVAGITREDLALGQGNVLNERFIQNQNLNQELRLNQDLNQELRLNQRLNLNEQQKLNQDLTQDLTQSLKLNQELKLDIVNIIPPTPPSTPPFAPPFALPFGLPSGTGKQKKRQIKQVPVYSVLARRRGRFTPIATDLTKSQALQVGSNFALNDLARTFKIVDTGKQQDLFGVSEDFMPNQQQFRTYKVRRGKKIELQNTFIQRTPTLLQSSAEKEQIAQAKRLKKIIGY